MGMFRRWLLVVVRLVALVFFAWRRWWFGIGVGMGGIRFGGGGLI